jgi:hypothetical protein
MSFNVSDIHDLTFHDLMAFVRLACMAKPFIYQRMSDIHPPTLQISSSYFSLTHSIKTRPLSLHAGQYFVSLSGPMVQCSRLPKRSKLLTVTALRVALVRRCS